MIDGSLAEIASWCKFPCPKCDKVEPWEPISVTFISVEKSDAVSLAELVYEEKNNVPRPKEDSSNQIE